MRYHYLIFVGEVVDGWAVEFVVKAILADGTSLHLKLVWNIIDFIPHKCIVLKVRVIFSKALDQLAKLHKVK